MLHERRTNRTAFLNILQTLREGPILDKPFLEDKGNP